jgi:hypothetical protein
MKTIYLKRITFSVLGKNEKLDWKIISYRLSKGKNAQIK